MLILGVWLFNLLCSLILLFHFIFYHLLISISFRLLPIHLHIRLIRQIIQILILHLFILHLFLLWLYSRLRLLLPSPTHLHDLKHTALVLWVINGYQHLAVVYVGVVLGCCLVVIVACLWAHYCFLFLCLCFLSTLTITRPLTNNMTLGLMNLHPILLLLNLIQNLLNLGLIMLPAITQSLALPISNTSSIRNTLSMSQWISVPCRKHAIPMLVVTVIWVLDLVDVLLVARHLVCWLCRVGLFLCGK